MIEITLLKMLENRAFYFKYHTYIRKFSSTKEVHAILKIVDKWYATQPGDTIDWTTFKSFFELHSPISATDKPLYDRIFSNIISHSPVSEAVARDVMDELVTRHFAASMGEVCMSIADGKKVYHMDDVVDMWHDYAKQVEIKTKDDFYVKESISELIKSCSATGGLEWKLPSLQAALGNLMKGSLIVVGARPDSGKTTFVANQVTHFASQLDPERNILWFNNEEDGGRIKRRLAQAALNLTVREMELDPQGTQDAYEIAINGLNDNKILVYDKSSISVREVESVIRDNPCDVIVFDQLRKIKGFTDRTSDHSRIEALYSWARELSKDVAPVIAVHQANAEAEGLAYIPMSLLEGNRTGLQGEVDAIIMLGRMHGTSTPNTRYLNVPKNKLDGGTGDRNLKREVEIDPVKGQIFDK